jgi:CheY-like chemotaxis protein
MQIQENFSILLVDDDSMVVRILNRILANFGPLRFATSGRLALKLALSKLHCLTKRTHATRDPHGALQRRAIPTTSLGCSGIGGFQELEEQSIGISGAAN